MISRIGLVLVLAAVSTPAMAEQYAVVVQGEAPGKVAFLKMKTGFPRPDSADAKSTVLGVCAKREAADLVRDIARLSVAKASVVAVADEASKDSCPTIAASKKGPGGHVPMVPEKTPQETAVVTDAPRVQWQLYQRFVSYGTAGNCEPFEVLARVEADGYVLGEKILKGECGPKKDIVWNFWSPFYKVQGDRRRVSLTQGGFKTPPPSQRFILLGFECNRISIVKEWERINGDMGFCSTALRASGPPPRTWERLDSVQISRTPRCTQEWHDSCVHTETARRLVWDSKQCRYDEIPWDPPAAKEELVKAHAEFQ